ncbi:hypothetical protein MUO83_02215 [Candidatus Bathyarchaeota archaeon]|nr:hypothetical protein [Candidatus Bathyarchaeota archaeon]
MSEMMRYWKIVAGHHERREQAPDDIRSILLGDWLRKNYIAIGWGKDNPQHRVFRDEMKIGNRVVVVADGFIWAIGAITGEFKEKTKLPQGSRLYEFQREVVWYKITKLSYSNFEKSLKNKLGANRTINELSSDQWESIVNRV